MLLLLCLLGTIETVPELKYYPEAGVLKENLEIPTAVFKQYSLDTPISVTHSSPSITFTTSQCLSEDNITTIQDSIDELLQTELAKYSDQNSKSTSDIKSAKWAKTLGQSTLLQDLECSLPGGRDMCSSYKNSQHCNTLNCCYDSISRNCLNHIYPKAPASEYITQVPNVIEIKDIFYTSPINKVEKAISSETLTLLTDLDTKATGLIPLCNNQTNKNLPALKVINDNTKFWHTLRLQLSSRAAIDTVNVFASVGNRTFSDHEKLQMISNVDQTVTLLTRNEADQTTFSKCTLEYSTWGTGSFDCHGIVTDSILFKTKISQSLCTSACLNEVVVTGQVLEKTLVRTKRQLSIALGLLGSAIFGGISGGVTASYVTKGVTEKLIAQNNRILKSEIESNEKKLYAIDVSQNQAINVYQNTTDANFMKVDAVLCALE